MKLQALLYHEHLVLLLQELGVDVALRLRGLVLGVEDGAPLEAALRRLDRGLGYRAELRVVQELLVHCVLVVVLIPGVGLSANGVTRWLGVGPFTMQPSELVKFAIVLFAADL